MEILDLYDKDRNITGKTFVRKTKQPQGYYRLIVHLCIFNSKNELLIQQRTLNKKMPGLWDVTCGGAVDKGETASMGISRELYEELGLNLDFSNERAAITANFPRGFDDFFIKKCDVNLDDLVLQEDEVDDIRRADLETVLKLRKDRKFVPYKVSFIKLLYELGNDKRYVEL